ncbi:hypothetical protein Tco_0379837, partial [Tanacetum coccineum]
MFETSSYKSLLEHIALYESLEASMKRAHRDELLAEKDKSRKIKALLLLHQILIKVRREDMTLALQAHHSLQLYNHLPGSQLTLDIPLQAPPSNNL